VTNNPVNPPTLSMMKRGQAYYTKKQQLRGHNYAKTIQANNENHVKFR
jgi:hypothetical protein